MDRATVFVLLGGLALTLAFVLAPGEPRARPYVPASDVVVLEVLGGSDLPADGGTP
jgi:hypothetical protein